MKYKNNFVLILFVASVFADHRICEDDLIVNILLQFRC